MKEKYEKKEVGMKEQFNKLVKAVHMLEQNKSQLIGRIKKAEAEELLHHDNLVRSKSISHKKDGIKL